MSFGAEFGFIVCNTPSYSPESNGMAEAFVKTFKRDYVYLNERRSAAHDLDGTTPPCARRLNIEQSCRARTQRYMQSATGSTQLDAPASASKTQAPDVQA